MPVLAIRKLTLLKGESSEDDDSAKEQKIYTVTFDAPPANRGAVITAVGIARGDPFQAGDLRLCKSIKVAPLGTGATTCDYIATYDYETPDAGGGGGGGTPPNPNPLLRPDKLEISGASFDRAYRRDFSATPKYVLTSAFQPFETLPQNKQGAFSIVVTGNRASFDAAVWPTYLGEGEDNANAINSAAVTIRGLTFPAKTLLMLNMRASIVDEDVYTYLQVEWTMAVKTATWATQKIFDRGTVQMLFDPLGDPYWEDIYQENGTDKVTSPYPLDGTGLARPFPDDDPAILEFVPQPSKSFGVFSWTAT